MKKRALRGSLPERVMTTRTGWRTWRRPRTVKRGLSVRSVSAPIKIASVSPRSVRACRRAVGLVIQRDPLSGRVKRPSKLIPHFAITNGIPVAIHLLNDSFNAAHSCASTPALTSIPALRKISIPRPRWRGFGSVAPITTDFTPARTISSVQAPVRPFVEHGSNVT